MAVAKHVGQGSARIDASAADVLRPGKGEREALGAPPEPVTITLDRLEPSPVAGALEPAWLRQVGVVPIQRRGTELILAAVEPDDATLVREIRRRARLEPRLVPATPEEVAEALDRLEGRPPSAGRLRDRLVPVLPLLGVWRPLPPPPAGESPSAYLRWLVEERHAGEHDLATSMALAYGLPRWTASVPVPPAGVEQAIPVEVARQHLMLPGAQVGPQLVLVCAVPPPVSVIRQLERQTGWVAQATVAPLSDVDAAIARWSRGRPAGGPARPAGRQVNGGQGLGLPHLALEEVHLDLALVRALPRDLARTYQLVPLWQAGRVLVAAVARWPLPEAARALLDRTGLFLRPVLADGPAIGAALDRTEAPHAYPLPEGYLELEERLARDRAVPRARLVAARERLLVRGEPTDVALAATDALAGADLAAALADSAGLPLASLDLASHDEPGIDPLGREVVRARVVDPVDPAAAGLIDEAQAWTWCALPFRRERGAVRVAVADPLSPALPALQAAIGQPVLGAVAPRDELEDAIHRTLGRPGVGQRVVAAGLATPAQLKQALELGRRTGVRVGTALVGLDYVSEDQLYAVLGEDAGLPFFSLDPALVAPEALTLLPEEVARQLLVLPIACDEASVTVATVEPLDASTLAALGEQTLRAVHQVLATERQLRQCLDAFYGQRFLERAASELLARSPEDSAYRVLSDGQKLILVGLLFGSAALLAANALAFLQAGVAFATLFIATLSAYKFYLIYRALSHSLEIPISREQVAALDERELPIYTILVPMYHEATVLPSLVRGLERLDYPRTKLDVKLLLEEDDLETREAAERLKLPPYCQVVVVPHGLPKGKPKACNYGLVHVKGEYVVIYDAEDLPDPDQLKKAILAFQTDESLACIQSKLNYFNRDQNILTRWFTAEYSVWFDLLLPGLDATNAPIPLGGTSNHFKTAQLRELGGWDPYNVTEDADLGLRLFARGWKTGVIDSTTYEEANSALYNWVRQRSRWVKGYIQTWLVRMRHPVALWRAIGPYGFFSFQMIVGGTFFSFLINPVFWLLTVLWFLTRWGVIQQLFPGAIFLLGALGLYAGNFVFTYLNVAGCLRRGYYGLVKYALLTPIYWALMSIAAWKGFLQLFYKPFYWEKTQHGLSAPPVLEPSSRGVEP